MAYAAQERYGRFEVIEPLADGAMGSLFLAQDPTTGSLVAIKTMLATGGMGPQTGDRESLLREARVAQLLSHPNIVKVHEIVPGNGADPPYVVMEYVQGTSLAAILAAGVPLPMDFVLSVTSQVAAALDHAHLKGVVHGDVKPGNILITDDEQARLIDFGIARVTNSGGETPERTDLGTPRYAAPEQAQGREIGRRADVFSLGVVAYEMLTGRPAFSGESSSEVTWKIARGMMDRPPSEIDALSAPLQCVLAQALHVDPVGRFASAGDFATALLGAADPEFRLQPPTRAWAGIEPQPEVDQVSTQDLSELAGAFPPDDFGSQAEPASGVLHLDADDLLGFPETSEDPAAAGARPREMDGATDPAVPEVGVFGSRDRTTGWKELLQKARTTVEGLQTDLDWRRVALVAGTTLVSALVIGLLTIWLAHPGDFDNLGFSAEHRLRQRVVPLLKEGHRLLQEDEPAIAARVFRRAEEIAPKLAGITALRQQAEREIALREQRQLDAEEFASLLAEGNRALRAGSYDRATEIARRLLEIDPEAANVLELGLRAEKARAEAKRRSQEAIRQQAAEALEAESSSPAVEPIRSAGVPAVATSAPQPLQPAMRPDWTRLKVDLFSYLPKGVVTIYSDDDQIFMQPFRFTERGRLFLKKGTAGRLEAEQQLSAGDTQFRIYVSSEGKETQVVNLPANLLGGETHVLRIIVAENGSTSAQLD